MRNSPIPGIPGHSATGPARTHPIPLPEDREDLLPGPPTGRGAPGRAGEGRGLGDWTLGRSLVAKMGNGTTHNQPMYGFNMIQHDLTNQK